MTKVLAARKGLSDYERRQAAEAARGGKLVVFPTETVYGVGVNAFAVAALERLFSVKRRPKNNPLIVHVSGREQAETVVDDFPALAEVFAERFWPGPLTMVLAARAEVPELVRAGRPTVGVRAPDHPVTLGLLREAGVPLAGTSANLAGAPAALTLDQALADLGDAIDLAIDAGESRLGVESTVLDLTSRPTRLWRSGAIEPEALLETAASAGIPLELEATEPLGGYLRGTVSLDLIVVAGSWPQSGRSALERRSGLERAGRQAALLLTEEGAAELDAGVWISLGEEPERLLYSALRQAMAEGVEVLVVPQPPGPAGGRLVERLQRAGARVEYHERTS